MTAPLASNPDYHSPEYFAMQRRWNTVRLVRDINDSLRTQSAQILPKYDAEFEQSWLTRVNMTFAFDALDETIHALVGTALRDDPELEPDVPQRLRDEWEDLDGQGTHGAVLAQHALDAAIQDGHCALLVDYPKAPAGLSLAQEQAMGLRAYVMIVPIDRISAWRIGTLQGRRVLTMVKIEEVAEVPDGLYGMRCVKQFRTLTQNMADDGTPFVTFTVHQEQPVQGGVSEWTQTDTGTINGPEWIPFYPVYGGEQRGILRSLPPLRGLAYSNLDHTQIKSDRRYSMHKCAIAIPIFKGRVKSIGEQATIVMSSDGAFDVSENGGGEYMEPKGTALQALRDEMTDIERRMGSQGFSMLRSATQQEMTATEKVLQQHREDSKLVRAVRSLNDALESALGAMADFYGMDSGGSVTLQREFNDTILSPDELKVLIELEDAGKLTLETMLRQLQKSTPILEGVDIPEEVAAIKLLEAEEPALAMPGMVVIPAAPDPAAPAPPEGVVPDALDKAA